MLVTFFFISTQCNNHKTLQWIWISSKFHTISSLVNQTHLANPHVSHEVTFVLETLKAVTAWELWFFPTFKFNMSQQRVLCGIRLKAIWTPVTRGQIWYITTTSLFWSKSGSARRLVTFSTTIILWISKRFFNYLLSILCGTWNLATRSLHYRTCTIFMKRISFHGCYMVITASPRK
jgi:hypothetical protein